MSKETNPIDASNIPVLETPSADMVNDALLEELDIPILTTPAEPEKDDPADSELSSY